MRLKNAKAYATKPAITPAPTSTIMCCFVVSVLTKSAKLQKVTDAQISGNPRYNLMIESPA
jgi:hypothetical protein